MTDAPRLYGASYSVYVRIARLALEEKGVDHDLVPVDVFAPDGPPEWYRELHPFGRIPAFEHGSLKLFETGAITRYVDEAFAGPPLQPESASDRALMNQIMGLLDAYAYRAFVWDVYVERVSRPREGHVSNEGRIAVGLATAGICMAALAALKRDGPWLLGLQLSLADLHAAPMFAYFLKAPEGRDMLACHPALHAWWTELAALPSFIATEPKD